MNNDVKVYYPEIFSVMLSLVNNASNNCFIYNELDYNMYFPNFLDKIPKKEDINIFLLNNLEKFGKISFKSNFLEIGACTSYWDLFNFGEKNIPKLFYEFLNKFNDKVILNSINIANGFYLKDSEFDSFPIFLSLESQFEFRNIVSRKTQTFYSYDIDRTEYIQNRDKIILSKIKIPVSSIWNRSYYYKTFFNNNLIVVCILLNIKKDFVSDFLVKIFLDDKVFQFKDFQLFLLDKTLPLSFSEIKSSVDSLKKNIKDIKHLNLNIDDVNIKMIINFYIDILLNLEEQV